MASFIEKKPPEPFRRKRRMLPELPILADADFCYLTTTGRVSGRPHTIEIWFALHGHTLYMLSGARDRSDWVKNALRSPAVQVRINGIAFSGQARVVNGVEEEALARTLLTTKYTPRPSYDLLSCSLSHLPLSLLLPASPYPLPLASYC